MNHVWRFRSYLWRRNRQTPQISYVQIPCVAVVENCFSVNNVSQMLRVRHQPKCWLFTLVGDIWSLSRGLPDTALNPPVVVHRVCRVSRSRRLRAPFLHLSPSSSSKDFLSAPSFSNGRRWVDALQAVLQCAATATEPRRAFDVELEAKSHGSTSVRPL